MTVRELAKMVGRTPGYISRVEARGEIPSAALICQLADVLLCSAAGLLDAARVDLLRRTEYQIRRKHAEALTLYRRSK